MPKRKSRKKTYRMKSKRKSVRRKSVRRKSVKRKSRRKSVKRKSRRNSRRKSRRNSRRKSRMLEDFGKKDIAEWQKQRDLHDIIFERKRIEVHMKRYLQSGKNTTANTIFEEVKKLLRLQKELCKVPEETKNLAETYYTCF